MMEPPSALPRRQQARQEAGSACPSLAQPQVGDGDKAGRCSEAAGVQALHGEASLVRGAAWLGRGLRG